MHVQHIADGLWRWTTPHPEWVEDGAGAASWPRDVGCVYYEGADTTVVIDPLIPRDPAQRARFLDALDRDVKRRTLPVAVLCSVSWHRRSCAELIDRYDAITDAPTDVLVHALGDPGGEVSYELPAHRTLVVADALVGSDVIGLRSGAIAMCPGSWQDGSDAQRRWWRDDAPAVAAALARRPIDRVLVSHGTPVLADGATLLAKAVALTRTR